MPCITKSGLVHVHVLLKKEEYRALKRRARESGVSVSLMLRSLLAERLGFPAGPAVTGTDGGKYQADN